MVSASPSDSSPVHDLGMVVVVVVVVVLVDASVPRLVLMVVLNSVVEVLNVVTGSVVVVVNEVVENVVSNGVDVDASVVTVVVSVVVASGSEVQLVSWKNFTVDMSHLISDESSSTSDHVDESTLKVNLFAVGSLNCQMSLIQQNHEKSCHIIKITKNII